MCIQKLIFSQCLMTACGMISFGGLLSEQLPCFYLYLDNCMREGRPFRRIRLLFSLNNICRRREYPKHQVSCFLLKNIYKRREDPKHQVSFFSICNRREEPVYQASICHQACVHCPMCILVHAFIAIASIQKTLLTYSLNFAIFFRQILFSKLGAISSQLIIIIYSVSQRKVLTEF